MQIAMLSVSVRVMLIDKGSRLLKHIPNLMSFFVPDLITDFEFMATFTH